MERSPPNGIPRIELEATVDQLKTLKLRKIDFSKKVDDLLRMDHKSLDQLITSWHQSVHDKQPQSTQNSLLKNLGDKVNDLSLQVKKLKEEFSAIEKQYDYIVNVPNTLGSNDHHSFKTSKDQIYANSKNDIFVQHVKRLKIYRHKNLTHLRTKKPKLLEELDKVIEYLDNGYDYNKDKMNYPTPHELYSINQRLQVIDDHKDSDDEEHRPAQQRAPGPVGGEEDSEGTSETSENSNLDSSVYSKDFDDFVKESALMNEVNLHKKYMEDQLLELNRRMLTTSKKVASTNRQILASRQIKVNKKQELEKRIEMERELQDIAELKNQIRQDKAKNEVEKNNAYMLQHMNNMMAQQTKMFQNLQSSQQQQQQTNPNIIVINTPQQNQVPQQQFQQQQQQQQYQQNETSKRKKKKKKGKSKNNEVISNPRSSIVSNSKLKIRKETDPSRRKSMLSIKNLSRGNSNKNLRSRVSILQNGSNPGSQLTLKEGGNENLEIVPEDEQQENIQNIIDEAFKDVDEETIPSDFEEQVFFIFLLLLIQEEVYF